MSGLLPATPDLIVRFISEAEAAPGAWVDSLAASVRQGEPGVYVNFLIPPAVRP